MKLNIENGKVVDLRNLGARVRPKIAQTERANFAAAFDGEVRFFLSEFGAMDYAQGK